SWWTMAVTELHRNRRPGIGARELSRAATEERLAIVAVDPNRRNLELLMELLDRAGYRGIGGHESRGAGSSPPWTPRDRARTGRRGRLRSTDLDALRPAATL